jgi:hypothetical protein
VTVQWASPAPGSTTIQLLRSPAPDPAQAVVIASGPATAVGSLSDTSTLAGVTYTYYLRALAAASTACPSGQGTLSAPLTASRLTPVVAAPSNVTVLTACEPLLVAFSGVPGADGYAIYTSLTPTLAPGAVPAAVTPATSGLAAPPAGAIGTVYVHVAALNACGTGAPSAPVAVTLGSPPAPVASASVYASGNCASLTLAWTPAAGASEYQVFAGATTASLGFLTTVAAPTTSLAVTLPGGATRQVFRVLARSSCGQAPAGADAEFDRTLPAAIPQSPASLAVDSGQAVTLAAVAVNAASLQWTRDGVALADSGRVSGSRSPTLRIAGASPADTGVYVLEASGCVLNAQPPARSSPAVLGVRGSACPADADNNGQRTIDDVFVFLNLWFAGCP